MKHLINIQHNRGVSLVELMVATTLGMVLMFGLGSLFVNNKYSYTVIEQRGRLQENLRFSMDAMVNSIRMANYKGCRHDAAMPSAVLSGVDGGSSNADEVTLRHISVVSLATYDRTNGADFEAAQPHQLRIGDTIAIQNCNGMGTAQITAITLDTPSAGTDTVTLDSTPAAELDGGTIHRYLTRRYHIQNNTLALNGTELIGDSARDRIENMQILYGQDTDTDGDVDAYRIATNVTDWNQVISIKIALLLATEEFGEETDTNTYSLLGTTVDPTDDRRKRKVTTTTVQMRNRMSSI